MGLINNHIYRFINVNFPTQALNVYGASAAASTGRNVCLYSATADPDDPMQKWKYQEETVGKRLHSYVNNGYVLDRSSGITNSAANNAHLCATDSTNGADSALYFVPVSGEENVYRIRLNSRVDGVWRFLTAANNNGTTPASSITTVSQLSSANKNVYWAEEATTVGSTAYKKQCWTVVDLDAEEDEGGSSEPGNNDDSSATWQRLIMPINNSNITAAYKENCPAYHEQGFADPMHYAVDMTGNPKSFYASGDGEVVGYSNTNDGPLGKWLAVRYNNVIGVNGTEYNGLIFRYCHLEDVYKTSGFVHVDDEEPMARMGNTGTKAVHLHVEVDEDVDHPNKTPTIKAYRNGLIPAEDDDTTIDPFLVFHKKITSPEYQTITPLQSYCDIANCEVCETYTQYEDGKVPYINELQCENVPSVE